MRPLTIGLALCLASFTSAQERGYWIANRASGDIMEVSPWGSVLQRIDMGTSLRSAHVAPDGKIWVIRFIQSTFDVVDPATGVITPVTSTLGSPYDIAFDAAGEAWVSGGTGVQHFDANGTLVQAYPLAQSAPLGVTVDVDGNKWIAHRTIPGSVSRIDPAGVITNYPVTGDNPVRAEADYRGLLVSSHIWITCDNGGALLEIDPSGTELNNYPMPSSSIGGVGPVFDRNGDVWVGSFSTGDLFQVDETNGTVLNTYNIPPSINGLSIDTQGRLLCAQRITFSGAGPACQVRRVDPATGTVEMVTDLEIGGFVATGTQSAVSTPWLHSLVADQIGDTDGDGDVNFNEATNGTSPIDASSDMNFSVVTTGVTGLGGNADVEITTGALWLVGFTPTLATPTAVPGFNGVLQVDANQLLLSVAGVGSATYSIGIANNPALVGYEVVMQGVIYTGTELEFRNVAGIRVW